MLTAVERFARTDHVERDRYRSRLPAAAPGPGQQYAFEVDLDACTGCKACVVACHSRNDLDPGESWRQVGLLVGTDAPYQQAVTTGCHHCVDPACLSGCPVDAYEKDPVTGIVRHLDDQCIGCRYCTLMCPYEVPTYNARLGIVRKCDLCAARLEAGAEPACVQGCPTSAISITLVDVSDVRRRTSWSIPASPSPTLTAPATVFRSARPVPVDAVPADHHRVAPAAGHRPLAVMLVLSQLAVGTYLAASHRAGVALAVVLLALASSISHLGRPLHAWRAVLGLGHSWVSREIVAFSAFTALAALHAVLGKPPGWLPGVTAGFGIAGVVCSMAIYAATGRRWWRASRLTIAFGLSTAGLALGVGLVDGRAWASVGLAVTTALRLGSEAEILRHRGDATGELGRTAALLTGPLLPQVRWRVGLAVAGGIVLPVAAAMVGSVVLAGVALVALIAGELLDRTLLFTASAAPRMPGDRR